MRTEDFIDSESRTEDNRSGPGGGIERGLAPRTDFRPFGPPDPPHVNAAEAACDVSLLARHARCRCGPAYLSLSGRHTIRRVSSFVRAGLGVFFRKIAVVPWSNHTESPSETEPGRRESPFGRRLADNRMLKGASGNATDSTKEWGTGRHSPRVSDEDVPLRQGKPSPSRACHTTLLAYGEGRVVGGIVREVHAT